jgi:hypothetical protein
MQSLNLECPAVKGVNVINVSRASRALTVATRVNEQESEEKSLIRDATWETLGKASTAFSLPDAPPRANKRAVSDTGANRRRLSY